MTSEKNVINRRFSILQPLDEELERQRNTSLIKSSSPHFFLGQLPPVFVFFVFYHQADKSLLWWWAIISIFSMLLSASLVYHYQRNTISFSEKQWSQWIFMVALVLALCRAAAPLMFIGSGSYIDDIVLVIIMVGVSTGGMVALSMHLPACLAFIFLILTTLSWSVWQQDIANSDFVAVLVLAYAVLLTAQAIKLNRVQVSNIRLRLDYEKARAAMEQANASKARFLSATSHDIRQPLQAAGLFVSALESDCKNPDNMDLFDSLKQSLSGMSSMLNHLLDIATLDEGGIKAYPKTVALNALLEKLQQRFITMAKEKSLVLRLESKLVSVRTDPELLERVLSNLLVNAITHVGHGEVVIRSRASGDVVEVCVEDTGPGIPAEQQAGVFEPFYQLDGPRRGQRKGSGLGLAIVKGFCELLGHPLRLESELGQGCRFYLQLPRVPANDSPADSPAPATVHAWSLQGRYILVMDDDPDVLKGMQIVLERWGCEVRCVSTLAEAKVQVQAKAFDLVVSDFNLGDGEDGVAAITALRQQQPMLPALIISGELHNPALNAAKVAGWIVLNKPVKPGELRAALQYAMRSE